MTEREKGLRSCVKRGNDALDQGMRERSGSPSLDPAIGLLIAQNNLIILLLDEMNGDSTIAQALKDVALEAMRGRSKGDGDTENKVL